MDFFQLSLLVGHAHVLFIAGLSEGRAPLGTVGHVGYFLSSAHSCLGYAGVSLGGKICQSQADESSEDGLC